MKRTLRTVALLCITVALLLSTVSCAFINETILGKEHEHKFKKPTQTVAPTCVAEGKQTATCSCGMIEVTILPATGNKGGGVKALREYLGNITKVVCIGDYENDISMVKYADIGYAVSNAIDELKDCADRITVSNNESAIAKIISEL